MDRVVFNRQTVLMVEDDEDDAFFMQSAFQEADVPNPLQVVGDGERAIAYLQGEGDYGDRKRYPLPVVILMDLNMPKKNGLEVLEWLRQQPGLKRTTVYIFTASIRDADVTRAFDLGANAYMVKPSQFHTLVDMVKVWHRLAQFKTFPGLRL